MKDKGSLINKVDSLKYYFLILYPEFYIAKNKKEDELIFLKINENDESVIDGFDSNTQCEALENHFHLFDKVNKRDREDARFLSLKIANNLMHNLYVQFPNRKFIIYVDLNYKDSIIVRFHQVWNNESIYYEENFWKEEYEKGKLIII